MTGKLIVIGAVNVGGALQYQMGASRSVLAPQVPAFKEQGFDIELASLRGVAAPKGLPESVRTQLVDAIARIASDPQFQQQAEAMFAPLRYLPPGPYAAEIERAEAGFRQLWKDMPWQEDKQ